MITPRKKALKAAVKVATEYKKHKMVSHADLDSAIFTMLSLASDYLKGVVGETMREKEIKHTLESQGEVGFNSTKLAKALVGKTVTRTIRWRKRKRV